ncbi:MAG: hypothetical protein QXQ50_03815 [Candidatus Bathyarchaeia archaeon]
MPIEQVQEVLRRTGLPITEMGQNLWQVDVEGYAILLTYKPQEDVLELILPFSTVPEGAGEEFYRFLLEKNFDEVLYGAFAIKGREVVLVDRLNCADLHEQEVIGSVKALKNAMLQSIPIIKAYLQGK